MCVLDLADLPLVKFDFSCNKVSTIPVCYRKMTQLQSLQLENNPLQSPPAQVTHTHTHTMYSSVLSQLLLTLFLLLSDMHEGQDSYI